MSISGAKASRQKEEPDRNYSQRAKVRPTVKGRAMAGEESDSDPHPRPSDSGNLPSTPDSPTSAGFNTDQLPPSRTSEIYSDEDEASVDPRIITDEPEDVEDEEEGEDLYNDNFMESVFGFFSILLIFVMSSVVVFLRISVCSQT